MPLPKILTSNKRIIVRISLAIILLGLIGAVAFAYRELSSIRRDLYAIRKDYYADYWVNYYDSAKTGDQEATYELIAQEVKTLRVEEMGVAPDYKPEYKRQSVRVVTVKVKNTRDYVLNYVTGDVGYASDNGILRRPIVVHPDDDTSEEDFRYSVDLAPGGEATVKLYFKDTGKNINKVFNRSSGNGI